MKYFDTKVLVCVKICCIDTKSNWICVNVTVGVIWYSYFTACVRILVPYCKS